ncbi:MAG: hypothetical protein CR986_07025 [Ignavibacteriae bacterium]|nr:MAG: hypothetical protein CR986_07025 [Ignavibacteriota bacterium]
MKIFDKNAKLPVEGKIKKRIELILEKKKKILTFLVLGLLLGAVVSLLLPKKYRATASILLDFKSYNNTLLKNSGNLNNFTELINTPELLNKEKKILDDKGFDITVSEISEAQEITLDNLQSTITITAISNNAKKTAAIANATAKLIQEKSVLNNNSVLLNGLTVVKNRINLLNKNISNGLNKNESSVFDNNTERLLNQIAEFESELEDIEIENQFYGYKLNELKEELKNLYPAYSEIVLNFSDEKFVEDKTKLVRIIVKNYLADSEKQARIIRIVYPWQNNYNISDLASATSIFNKDIENYLDDKFKNDDINNFEFLKNLVQTIYLTQNNITAIDISKNIIFTTLTNLENEFNKISYNRIDRARTIRTNKFNKSLSVKLNLQQQKLLNKKNEYFAKVNSVNNALTPESYFSPNIILNILLGGLLGLIIGIITVASSTTEKLDEINSADDIIDFGYKIVARIPTFPIGTPVLLDTKNESEGTTIPKEVIAPFDNIETFLRYGNLDKKLKTVFVTSGKDEEGKSLIASNIALTLANKGNKVLIVDTDVLAPQQHKNFNIKSTPSLAHYLFREKKLNEIINNSYNPNLDIITSIEIPQEPSVILSSDRMKNFMDEVNESYDFVIYDSCSLSAINEVAILAANTNETLLVIRGGKSKISDVIETANILKQNGISKFNVILNEIKA